MIKQMMSKFLGIMLFYFPLFIYIEIQNFGKTQEVFDPERFGENGDKEAIRKAYYPFGGGPRMCIGNNFALWEITLVLAMMMYHFDFEYVENQKIEFQPLVTLKPKYGIQLNLKPIN